MGRAPRTIGRVTSHVADGHLPRPRRDDAPAARSARGHAAAPHRRLRQPVVGSWAGRERARRSMRRATGTAAALERSRARSSSPPAAPNRSTWRSRAPPGRARGRATASHHAVEHHAVLTPLRHLEKFGFEIVCPSIATAARPRAARCGDQRAAPILVSLAGSPTTRSARCSHCATWSRTSAIRGRSDIGPRRRGPGAPVCRSRRPGPRRRPASIAAAQVRGPQGHRAHS